MFTLVTLLTRPPSGYGDLCHCSGTPDLLETLPAPLSAEHTALLAHIPIVIVASNRPQYLYRMLSALVRASVLQLTE